MKTISIICLLLIASVSAWAQQREAVGFSKTNTDFSKYKSFTWAQSDATVVGPGGYDIYYYEFESNSKEKKKSKNKAVRIKDTGSEPYIYSYSVIIPAKDESTNSVITEAISNELEGRGYREEASTGDLIVAYQVLDRRAVLHGYINDQPEVAGGREVRQPSDTTSFILEPGSLIVTLVDAKTSEVVWDGYNTGLNNNEAFVTDEVELKEAVHKIFEEFKYTADKARKTK